VILNSMKTIAFEIPTMIGQQSRVVVQNALKKIGAMNVKIKSRIAEVTIQDSLKKVDLIIAIEETGNVVKY
ncbi:MAG TPA: hypothetical protein VGD90_06240, partial [Sphingobacteriaceae bacterium]